MASQHSICTGTFAFSRLCIFALMCLAVTNKAYGSISTGSLADLSFEDLGNIEITSVSKHSQKLREAAASIFVISQEDIRRSGANSIMEALRLAPNLQVARSASNGYAISSRGFNTTTTNKLLVLIDGRSVYTPLYSGVFWDVQDTLISDIDRIEVISGPGASLWGANAVNGVINIITRNSTATQGTLATIRAGNEEKSGSIRYGGKSSNDTTYRVYTKYFDRGASVNASGNSRQDTWSNGQGGFRIDKVGVGQNWTLQGDIYRGSSDQPIGDNRQLSGGNLLGRWNHNLENGDVQIQTYFDHTRREQPGTFAESLDTIDLDIQHRFKLNDRNQILWGGGYRDADDRVDNTALLSFLPAHTHLKNANLFFQDQITLIPNTLQLSLGTKFEHNSYSGLDIQPDARLSWTVSDQHQLWGAISRAARAPSRIDRDFYVPAPAPSPPGTLVLAGGPNFTSEILTAYQLGYRGQLFNRLSFSSTVFYHDYKKLRSLNRDTSGVYTISNDMEGSTRGIELWGEARLLQNWRLYMGYTHLQKNLRLLPGASNPTGPASEGNDPNHQFTLRSTLDLAHNLEFDSMVRHIAALPNPSVPAYTALDMRLGWKPSQQWELALVGQNLLDSQHPEFGASTNRSEIERSIFIKSTWKF